MKTIPISHPTKPLATCSSKLTQLYLNAFINTIVICKPCIFGTILIDFQTLSLKWAFSNIFISYCCPFLSQIANKLMKKYWTVRRTVQTELFFEHFTRNVDSSRNSIYFLRLHCGRLYYVCGLHCHRAALEEGIAENETWHVSWCLYNKSVDLS